MSGQANVKREIVLALLLSARFQVQQRWPKYHVSSTLMPTVQLGMDAFKYLSRNQEGVSVTFHLWTWLHIDVNLVRPCHLHHSHLLMESSRLYSYYCADATLTVLALRVQLIKSKLLATGVEGEDGEMPQWR